MSKTGSYCWNYTVTYFVCKIDGLYVADYGQVQAKPFQIPQAQLLELDLHHFDIIIWKHVTGEFPSQRPVTRSFDVFVDLRLIKRLSKPSIRRRFETPWRSLWRHSNNGIENDDIFTLLNVSTKLAKQDSWICFCKLGFMVAIHNQFYNCQYWLVGKISFREGRNWRRSHRMDQISETVWYNRCDIPLNINVD